MGNLEDRGQQQKEKHAFAYDTSSLPGTKRGGKGEWRKRASKTRDGRVKRIIPSEKKLKGRAATPNLPMSKGHDR